jgi:hypothetical protein
MRTTLADESRRGQFVMRRYRWQWIVGGLLTAVIASFTGVGAWQRHLLNAQLEAVRAAGEPVTIAELERLYQPPAAERDATTLWMDGLVALKAAQGANEEAFRYLPLVGDDYRGDPLRAGAPLPEVELAERYLATRSEALRCFREAADRGGSARFPLIESPPPDTVWSEELLFAAQKASRVLELQTLVCAHRGDSAGVVASLDTRLALAASLNGFPDSIAALRQFAILSSAVDDLMELLPRVPFSEDDLARFQHRVRVQGFAIEESRRAVLCGARVSSLSAFTKEARGLRVRGFGGYVWHGLQISFLELMAECVGISQMTWPEALDAIEELEDRMAASNSRFDTWARLHWPSVRTYLEAACLATARQRAADTALAVERYRRRNGRLPSDLTELVPAFLPVLPVDPFTGEILLYACDAEGFAVYSVGLDRIDDGGSEGDQQSRAPDVVVAVRASAR